MKEREGKADKFPRLLICEGRKDALFFHNFIHTRSLPRFHIRDARGKDRIGETIRAYKAEPKSNFPSLSDILVVADNDEDPEERFKAIQAQISEAFDGAAAPAKELVKSKTKPRCTIVMLPLDGKNGTLESLVRAAAVSRHGKTTGAVDMFLANVNINPDANQTRHDKAWLRSYLAASCTDPFVPLGDVFDTTGYRSLIPLNHASLDRLAQILDGFEKTKKC